MTEQVLSEVRGAIGHIELNRPEKLNALNLGMLQELHRVLNAWATDSSIALVLLTGRGERGFCAGGDIANFHRAVNDGQHSEFLDLLELEFDTDHLLSVYPKPVISIAHGITMGGGIGLASHAPVRLVTSDATLAMPEVRIGYTPDVGGSHLLALAPGYLGEYFALTASSFTGLDALYLGFADVTIAPDATTGIIDELDDLVGLDAGQIIAALEVLHGVHSPAPIEAEQGWIDYAFGAPDVQQILDRLEAMKHPRAAGTAQAIRANSPTSVLSAFKAVRAAREDENLRAALDRELRLAGHLMHLPDLSEGIRAQLIDKDRTPRWQPEQLSGVDDAALCRAVRPEGS